MRRALGSLALPCASVVAALALAGAVAQAQGPASVQAPPVFGARVETVYVDAFVTRDGQPVMGLAATDFELKDNGVAQDIELVLADSMPLMAVLAFDASASVAGEKLKDLQAAGAAFLDGLKVTDEAALITFNEEVRWASKPSSDKARATAALATLRPRGGTAAFDGLYTALTLPVSKARSLVVLFSDGEDNLSWLGERQVKNVAERSNALVHVVGIVPPSGEPEMGSSRSPTQRSAGAPNPSTSTELPHNRTLRQIAESTGGRFWPAESPARLRHTFAAIAEAMSHRYILRYEPRSGAKAGWHRVELKLRGKPGRVEARRGYWVAPR